MKFKNVILITGLGFFSFLLIIYPGKASSANTVFVYKPDGTVHCKNLKGSTLDSMKQQLTSAGIKVFSSRKGYDGREGIAFCGNPTGQINIYEIVSSDLSVVLKIGFKPLPENQNKKKQ